MRRKMDRSEKLWVYFFQDSIVVNLYNTTYWLTAVVHLGTMYEDNSTKSRKN